MNCLSVFDHFVGLAFKWLIAQWVFSMKDVSILNSFMALLLQLVHVLYCWYIDIFAKLHIYIFDSEIIQQ